MILNNAKKLDAELERLFRIHGANVPLNMMDLPKIFAECRKSAQKGLNPESVMIELINKYRKD